MFIAKKETLKEVILRRISDADIFRMYLGKFKVGGAVQSPFKADSHPSLLIGVGKGGSLFYQDMRNKEFSGDCFKLVMQLYGLGFAEALQKIACDFGIIDGSQRWELLKKEEKAPDIQRERKIFNIIERPFTQADLRYWARYIINEDDLIRENIFSIKSAWVNHSKIDIEKDELAFAYYFEELESWKYYFPHRPKGKKWFTNTRNRYVEGKENLVGVKKGILTKSRKDRIMLNKFIPTANVQNEGEGAFTEEFVGFIQENVHTLFLNFDNDNTGVENSQKITQKYGYKYVNAPRYLLKQGITDFSDWCAVDGIEPVLKYLKRRGVL